MVFLGVRARVRDAISPILRYSTLFYAILGPECLVDILFKVFLIFGSVPVLQYSRFDSESAIWADVKRKKELNYGSYEPGGDVRIARLGLVPIPP